MNRRNFLHNSAIGLAGLFATSSKSNAGSNAVRIRLITRGDGFGDIAVLVNVEEGREDLKGYNVKYIDIDPYGGSNGLEKDPVSDMRNNCLGIAVIHGTAAGWDAPAAKYIFYQCFSGLRIMRKGQKIRRGSGSSGPTPIPKGDSIQLDLETGGTMLVYWNGKTYRGFGQRIGD